ncbi:MAG TPA: hypothetical protein VK772_14135 [Puia sp.]|jgi:hypothetical protein|nr:hypothetical protein [Puia sp.]
MAIFRPPKYSEIEVQNIMESSQPLPDSIPESVYEKRLRDNSKLKWCINPFLARENKLNLFLSPAVVKKWLLLKKLNWVIALLIIAFSLFMKDNRILWGLLIFPNFMASGLFSIRNMIFLITIIYTSQFWFGFHSQLVLYFVIIILVTYILSKITFDFVEKNILRLAFSDPNTFWKFYSNKFIYIDRTNGNNEFQKLAADYPELNT